MKRIDYWYWVMMIVWGSCSSSNPTLEIPKQTQLIAKYITLDEVMSQNDVFCDYDSIRSFLEMQEFDCIFQLQNFRFKIDDKFKLGTDGKVVEYFNYLPMGTLTYDADALNADWGLRNELKLDRFFVQISTDRTRIIDRLDTCDIERIFFKEKLILMKQNESLKANRRRIFYQYQEQDLQK